MMIPAPVWRGLGDRLPVYVLLLLPPAILGGAAFPLMVRMVVDDPARAGPGVGRITAFNTLGGIVGSLAIGFLAVPRLGIQSSIALVTGLSLVAGFAAWLGLEERRRRLGWM